MTRRDPLSIAFANLKAQRDACVEALRRIATTTPWADTAYIDLKRSVALAKAALAKVEEKP